MPLRLRLALLFALATGLLIAAGGGLFLHQTRVSLEAALDTGLRARADVAISRLRSTPPNIQTTPSDEIVQALSNDGAVLNSTTASGPHPLLTPAQVRRATAGQFAFTAAVNTDPVRLLAVPTSLNGHDAVVVVGAGTEVSDAGGDRIQLALLAAGPPAVLLSGFAAWLLAGAALRPVERMRREVADITITDRDATVAVPATRDEIAALAVTMNDVLARLQRGLARERGFVADAGHELRTPLAILRTELELAARPGRSREALVEAIASAADETDRLSRLAEDLLLLARADEGPDFLRLSEVRLTEVLMRPISTAAARAAGRGVTIRLHQNDDDLVVVDPDRLGQALDNLLDNALRYAPLNSEVDVVVTTTTRGSARFGRIEVADAGPGFPAEFLPMAFERFRRADDSRTRADGGSGLGLAIVRSIAVAHGGRATARNADSGGAVVTIELPVPISHPVIEQPGELRGSAFEQYR